MNGRQRKIIFAAGAAARLTGACDAVDAVPGVAAGAWPGDGAGAAFSAPPPAGGWHDSPDPAATSDPPASAVAFRKRLRLRFMSVLPVTVHGGVRPDSVRP